MLELWKKHRRVCLYCNEAPVETVDHILPLALGGTNYEGNLAPACFDCNRLKMDNLLSAWRYGIGVRRWRVPVDISGVKRRPRKPKQLAFEFRPVCKWCGEDCGPRRRSFCSDECYIDWSRVAIRNKYRAEHGIPFDKPGRGERHGRTQAGAPDGEGEREVA